MNKTQQLKYFRKMINDIGLCDSLKSHYNDVYEELIKLFENHPEYPEKIDNVVDISIVHNKLNKNYFELQIIKNDGTTDDISYIKCIQKPSKDSNLKSAMRYAILDQILEFKNNCDELICEICKSEQNIQIDHIILFKTLYNDFLSQNTLPIPTTFDSTYYNSAMFKRVDVEFEKSWSDYHKQHAILRCLCNKCNQKRNKK